MDSRDYKNALLVLENVVEEFSDFFMSRTSSDFGHIGLSGDYGWFSVARGATRFVIIPDGFDFVIKIPFSNWEDYCLKEAFYYVEAVKADVRDSFAECIACPDFSMDTWCGRVTFPFYLMAKAVCNEEETLREVLGSSRYSSSSSSSSYYDCEDADADQVLDFLGAQPNFSYDTFSFLSKMQIDDIHCGNIGRINDNYVITDYAGFGCSICDFKDSKEIIDQVIEFFKNKIGEEWIVNED